VSATVTPSFASPRDEGRRPGVSPFAVRLSGSSAAKLRLKTIPSRLAFVEPNPVRHPTLLPDSGPGSSATKATTPEHRTTLSHRVTAQSADDFRKEWQEDKAQARGILGKQKAATRLKATALSDL